MAASLGAALELLGQGVSFPDLRIEEFMANNTWSLADEDGAQSDWIEIFNASGLNVNLDGWFLTDKASNLTKWRLPATNLAAGRFLVVFASEKNRQIPGRELHTNFKLADAGEYLGLVGPDGITIVSEFRPVYPVQAANVSYGWANVTTERTLVPLGAPARALIPIDASAEPPPASPPGILRPWTAQGFDDAPWLMGTTGVGYDLDATYLGMIGLTVSNGMYGSNPTVYIRIPFAVSDPAAIETLTLWMEYDDGFIAYLNGQPVASANAPTSPTWNSGALANRSDSAAMIPEAFNLTPYLGFLNVGINLLAIQGLNQGSESSDLLVRPRMAALMRGTGVRELRYFPVPTPGATNNTGTATLGPIITDETYTPAQPGAGDPITVTARLRPALTVVSAARLRYRVMFGLEQEVPMLDDGLHGDGAAFDGRYGGVIPPNVATNGQMLRWYITAQDAASSTPSRSPPFADPANSPEYWGTVIANPLLTNPLPVLHWFLQNPAAADTDTGTRCALFFLGEFYDNVAIHISGQASRAFPKKSYHCDFHPGFHFRWKPGEQRVRELHLLTTYHDKAHMRNYLAYEMYHDAGCPYNFVQSVRVQRNSLFWGDMQLLENGNDEFLERNGLDPQGALYKMYATFTSATDALSSGTAEKKTRRSEDHSDLLALFNGVVGQTGTARTRSMLDHLDIPEMINFLAGHILTSDRDCCHKNYYFYRDTEGNGEWQAFPDDVDFSFGRNWTSTYTYWDQNLQWNNPLDVGLNNGVFARLLSTNETPIFRQMYLRRIRTLMDELLQPPGTPSAEGKLEKRVTELLTLIRPDAELDALAWPFSDTWGNGSMTSTAYRQSITEAAQELTTFWLTNRRTFLYTALPEIPATQPSDAEVRFTALEYRPSSGNPAEQFVALSNHNSFAVDISGWQVSGPITHTFKPGTVLPMTSGLYLARDANAFRARTTGPRGNQGLFIQGNFSGQLPARGGTVSLHDRSGRFVHDLSYPGNPSLAQQYLRVTELMYHPAPPPPGSPYDAEDFEFIELKNIGNVRLYLPGVRLTIGVSFDFTGSAVTSLEPGQCVVVVRDRAAFQSRYGSLGSVAGEYSGTLDNAGESLQLLDAAGDVILEFAYQKTWHLITDGLGYSLAVADEFAPWEAWDQEGTWRANGILHGTPGLPNPPFPPVRPVLVNEVLSRSIQPWQDAIELYNPNEVAVDLGGWYLSDDFTMPWKFRFGPGAWIPPHGYLAIDEQTFNRTDDPGSFAFSSDGDEIFLFSADAGAQLTGYVHGFRFGASEPNVSFGRYLTRLGEEHSVPQISLSFSAANSGPRVGPVVMSEIMYHPSALPIPGAPVDNIQDEYIELYNVSASPTAFYSPNRPAETWRLQGAIEYTFPGNVSLAPGDCLLVIGFDPLDSAAMASFRSRHALRADVRICGPWAGKLSNNSGRLELIKPDVPEDGSSNSLQILMERVDYRDSRPWPKLGDGLGFSLCRIDAAAYGNDPLNWVAASPSPGQHSPILNPPVFTSMPASQTVLEDQPAAFSVTVAGAGPFTYLWQRDGNSLAAPNSPALVFPAARSSDQGIYSVTVVGASGAITSTEALLTVRRLPVILTQPQGAILTDPAPITLSVVASGTGLLRYQWYRDGLPIPGATGSNHTIASVQWDVNDGSYMVIVSDDIGSRQSQAALVTLQQAPIITSDLEAWPGTNILEGRTFTLSVAGQGSWPLGVVFRRNATTFAAQICNSNHFAATLTIDNAQSNLHTGTWRVYLTNGATRGTSSSLPISILPAAPFFALNPTDQHARAGQDVLLASEARGTAPITYQWFLNATHPVPAATNAMLMLSHLQLNADTSGDYTVVARNPLGTSTSAVARVTVALADQDEDGMPDAWETAHGFNAYDAADRDLDPDHDGRSNWEEFISGTDPTDRTSVFRVGLALDPQGAAVLQFTARPGIGYSVLRRDLLASGAWMTWTNLEPQSGSAVMQLVDPLLPAAGNRFYRVVAWSPY